MDKRIKALANTNPMHPEVLQAQWGHLSNNDKGNIAMTNTDNNNNNTGTRQVHEKVFIRQGVNNKLTAVVATDEQVDYSDKYGGAFEAGGCAHQAVSWWLQEQGEAITSSDTGNSDAQDVIRETIEMLQEIEVLLNVTNNTQATR